MKSGLDSGGAKSIQIIDYCDDTINVSLDTDRFSNRLYIECLSRGNMGEVINKQAPLLLDEKNAKDLIKILTYYVNYGKLLPVEDHEK